ncbi:LisH domain-containing protein C1711.05 [Taphrina deformans PYCC 5710]|uniref:LisH domain-containing protein C1711.05 n=1 Tax=Taphrina deformans (strain PYCC 5710 / ATCC 11124 / CBS 356.35 / IMI 108563 / JCM 9778 / NBRC 8474) TaxID=1097556 RepID=R4XFS1_TAPDE|nr:LisH domain-containing protein C1711.05 [Taphrina deformans PYCC 5710]|eukprot:CCG82214.1 LisH domain-containing protein C1711.05 [Taphrina deformans PYCC 5710]
MQHVQRFASGQIVPMNVTDNKLPGQSKITIIEVKSNHNITADLDIYSTPLNGAPRKVAMPKLDRCAIAGECFVRLAWYPRTSGGRHTETCIDFIFVKDVAANLKSKNLKASIFDSPEIYDDAFPVVASNAPTSPNDISSVIPQASYHSAIVSGPSQSGASNYSPDADDTPKTEFASQDYSTEFKSSSNYQDSLSAINDISAAGQISSIDPASYSDSQRSLAEKGRIASARVQKNQVSRLNTFDKDFEKLQLDYDDIMRSKSTTEQQILLRDRSQQMQRQLEDNHVTKPSMNIYSTTTVPVTKEVKSSLISPPHVAEKFQTESYSSTGKHDVKDTHAQTVTTPKDTTSSIAKDSKPSPAGANSVKDTHTQTVTTPKDTTSSIAKDSKPSPAGANPTTSATSASGNSVKTDDSAPKKLVALPGQKSLTTEINGNAQAYPARPTEGDKSKASPAKPAAKSAIPQSEVKSADKPTSTSPKKPVDGGKAPEQPKSSSSISSPVAPAGATVKVTDNAPKVQAPPATDKGVKSGPGAVTKPTTSDNAAPVKPPGSSTPPDSIPGKGKRSIRFVS